MSSYISAIGAALFDYTSKWFVGIQDRTGREISVPSIIAQSAVPVSLTGTLTETTLATIMIPGGAMGPNGSLRIVPIFSFTNNANAKTINLKLGGVAFNSPGFPSTAADQLFLMIRNRGAANSQISFTAGNATGLGTSVATPVVGTVNTAVDQAFTITGTLANIADTITLEGYTIELLPSP